MKKTMKLALFSQRFLRMALLPIISAFVLLSLGLLIEAPTAQAFGNCPVDRPCITDLHQQGHTLFITWTIDNGYDAYNIQWSRSGISAQQFEVDGSKTSSSLTNILPYTTYTFSIQGCVHHFLSSSTCSPWSFSEQIATVGSAADVCLSGFVWRQAGPNDFVCVTPYTRSQTTADNRQAKARRNPNGAYGPNTCIQGYVWRVAFPNDLVCVTPQTRDQVAADNRQAIYRVVH